MLIEWDFLKLALQKINLHPHLIKIIMSCVSTCRLSMRVNGVNSDNWNPARGLRQGDPLSAYLFIICQDLFVSKLVQEMEQGKIDMLKSCSQGVPIPILCFAEDCMLFCKVNRKSVKNFKNCLNVYATSVGQSICWNKSRINFSLTLPSILNKVLPSI